jgi:hypothetical protein
MFQILLTLISVAEADPEVNVAFAGDVWAPIPAAVQFIVGHYNFHQSSFLIL